MEAASTERLAPALKHVSDASGSVVEVESNGGDVEAARAGATDAAKAALDAGHSLGEVAAAESAGQLASQQRLRRERLRRVGAAAERLRAATTDYELSVTEALDFGLSAREIALTARANHSTIISIRRRHATREEAERSES
jgi:DNA-binding NarL/FixJ family response regulator